MQWIHYLPFCPGHSNCLKLIFPPFFYSKAMLSRDEMFKWVTGWTFVDRCNYDFANENTNKPYHFQSFLVYLSKTEIWINCLQKTYYPFLQHSALGLNKQGNGSSIIERWITMGAEILILKLWISFYFHFSLNFWNFTTWSFSKPKFEFTAIRTPSTH